jgi:hypothetical protein
VTREYIHQALNQEVTAIGGHYLLVKEARLPFEGREVLYLVGHAAFDTTCCGVGGCAYALVAGFLLRWKRRINERGLAVSEVESIHDQNVQQKLQQLIQKQEMVHQVRFL